MYRINQSHGCKPLVTWVQTTLTCDHLYGACKVWHRRHPSPRCAPTMASLSTLCAHNGCPRCAPTMAVHIVRPQWLSTLCAHSGILSTLYAHNGCLRCAPTMAVHVVRPQWLSTLYAHNGCPCCAHTMASLSTLCAHNGALVHVVRQPSSS